MSKELKCYCGKYLGEMEKGKVRNGTVFICRECWSEVKNSIEIFKNDPPDFLKNLFKNFGK